jgi:hypothetical protein
MLRPAEAGTVRSSGKGGDRGLKKVLTWAAIAFVIYYLATSPDGAANVVTGALNWLKSAGNSMAEFLNHIKL